MRSAACVALPLLLVAIFPPNDCPAEMFVRSFALARFYPPSAAAALSSYSSSSSSSSAAFSAATRDDPPRRHRRDVQRAVVVVANASVAPPGRWRPTPPGPLRMSYASSSYHSSSSLVETCKVKIAAALNTDDVVVTGAHDDPNGSHISIYVTSSMFEGKRPVQRQQLVYKALWEGERVGKSVEWSGVE
jgi:acid stress-induced BolA-like protein IbaG/YrbA